MARFLFVAPPFVGHLTPAVAVGQALAERGHEIAWVGHLAAFRELLPAGARLFPLQQDMSAEEVQAMYARFRSVRGMANLKLMWEEVFVPLARAMLPGVEDAAARFRPDVLVSDQQALAGALAARRLGIRWATSAVNPADRVTSLRGFPKVLEWTEELLAGLQREAGLEVLPAPEDSPELVLSYTTAALAGPAGLYPPQYRFVGPVLSRPADDTEFPWAELGAPPRVLVSLGTLNAERGGRFFAALKEALGGLELRVVCVAPEDSGPWPANFLVRPWVPQLRLLEQVQAVVSHAGSNTVCEVLAFGVPLVVLPITDGQPVIAQQVADAGAGLRLSFKRVRAEALRAAVLRVLAEPAFGAAAARVRASFAQAGGAARAAELVEALAHDPARSA